MKDRNHTGSWWATAVDTRSSSLQHFDVSKKRFVSLMDGGSLGPLRDTMHPRDKRHPHGPRPHSSILKKSGLLRGCPSHIALVPPTYLSSDSLDLGGKKGPKKKKRTDPFCLVVPMQSNAQTDADYDRQDECEGSSCHDDPKHLPPHPAYHVSLKYASAPRQRPWRPVSRPSLTHMIVAGRGAVRRVGAKVIGASVGVGGVVAEGGFSPGRL